MPTSRWTRSLVLAATVLFALPLYAQDRLTHRQKQVLQQQITRAEAVVVDPSVIDRNLATLTTPASPVVADGAAAATGVPDAAVTGVDTGHAAATAIEPAAIVARLNRGDIVFAKLDSVAEDSAQTLLEEKVASVDAVNAGTLKSFDGAVRQLATDDIEVQLKSYVLVGQPLQYDVGTGQFVGTVLVGVADLFGDGSPRTLTVPLRFQVLESALADPQEVALDSTSPPYQRIRVVSRVVGQPVTLRIASNFSREGISVQVPVEPTLMVDVDGDRLRAFGMQTAAITIRAVGFLPQVGDIVTVKAPGAFLTETDPVKFDERGVARATLRTDSPGPIVVTAVAGGFAPGSSSAITAVWPWPTLVATCLGGFVGGFVRLARRIRKGMNVGQYVLAIVVSIFLGIIVFASYLVGVKLVPVTFSVVVGDLFAFVVAALAAWIGTGLLPQATSKP